jgi:NAD(P)H-hydrate epimerase
MGRNVVYEQPHLEEEASMTEADIDQQQLEELFRETGRAHHQAYIETDGADPEWPLWYAEHSHEKLGALLGATFTRSELVCLIVQAAKEQDLRAPGANWPRYWARFFIERYG